MISPSSRLQIFRLALNKISSRSIQCCGPSVAGKLIFSVFYLLRLKFLAWDLRLLEHDKKNPTMMFRSITSSRMFHHNSVPRFGIVDWLATDCSCVLMYKWLFSLFSWKNLGSCPILSYILKNESCLAVGISCFSFLHPFHAFFPSHPCSSEGCYSHRAHPAWAIKWIRSSHCWHGYPLTLPYLTLKDRQKLLLQQ